jgi:hypothetical protein
LGYFAISLFHLCAAVVSFYFVGLSEASALSPRTTSHIQIDSWWAGTWNVYTRPSALGFLPASICVKINFKIHAWTESEILAREWDII